jgi:AcrR family transcriptional regulator
MIEAQEIPDTRTAILNATEQLLADYGYKKMTMEDVAAQAGLGRRTIYLHFPGKKQLALAVIDRIIDHLLAELGMIAASEMAPAERLHQMLIRRILFLFDRERDIRHTLDDVYKALLPKYKTYREKYIRREAELFAQVLREGAHRGQLDVRDPFEVGNALVMATNSLTPFSLNAQLRAKRKLVERKIHLIADMLIYGLARKQPNSR